MRFGFAFVAALVVSGAAAMAGSAPAFSLEDQAGKQVSLADLKGKVVVLQWWNEGCPYIVRHAEAKTVDKLAGQYKDVVFLAVNSTASATNQSNAKAVERFKLSYPILNDAKGEVGKAYGAKTTPHLFIIDQEGNIAYNGAIDNDPNGKSAKPTNYVAKALDELLAGKAVSTPETKPYGCGVHYGK